MSRYIHVHNVLCYLVFILFTETVAFPSDLGFIKVNVNQSGFYRVNYDLRNWYNIIAHLQSNPDSEVHTSCVHCVLCGANGTLPHSSLSLFLSFSSLPLSPTLSHSSLSLFPSFSLPPSRSPFLSFLPPSLSLPLHHTTGTHSQ